MKKNIIWLVSILLLVYCAVIPQLSNAQSDFLYNDFECSILTNGTVQISKYLGTSTDVQIPDVIEGMPVSQIGSLAFDNCTSVEKIGIPNSVIYIGDYAFRDCKNIVKVKIPENTRNVGDNPFVGCIKLETIEIARKNHALDEKNGVLFSTLDHRLVTYLHNNKNSIYHVPTDTLHIGDSAFWGNMQLKEIVLPDGLISIGSSAFAQCSRLTKICIPSGVKRISPSMCEGCFSLSQVSFPDSVKIIGYGAFDNCYCLSDVSIHDNNCIVVKKNSYADSENFCVSHHIDYEYLNFDDELITDTTATIMSNEDYEYAVYDEFVSITKYCGTSDKVVIPEKIDDLPVCIIDDRAFWTLPIEEIIFPHTLRVIGSMAFSECNELTEISIPSNVTTIQSSAFSKCTNLQSVEISGSVGLKLGREAFGECVNLRSVSITACDFVVMYDRLFADCPNLEQVDLTNTVWERSDFLEIDLFENCDNLKGITISTNCDWDSAKEFCRVLQLSYRYHKNLDWILLK